MVYEAALARKGPRVRGQVVPSHRHVDPLNLFSRMRSEWHAQSLPEVCAPSSGPEAERQQVVVRVECAALALLPPQISDRQRVDGRRDSAQQRLELQEVLAAPRRVIRIGQSL